MGDCGFKHPNGKTCGALINPDRGDHVASHGHAAVRERDTRESLIAELLTIPEPRVAIVRSLLFLLETKDADENATTP